MQRNPDGHAGAGLSAIIAGWVAGYVMALASTGVLVFLTVRLSGEGELLDRWVSREVPRPLLAVPIFLGTTLLWTMMGLVLGSIYEVGGFADKPGVLGAPSWVFLLLVAAVAWLPLPPLVIFARRFWPLWCGMALMFIALFGWLMPLLAAR
ncbi:MAG: hypothetical protein ACRDG3_04545 [Tepidiformaceae bacterium]